jgi:hypothetical protein
MTTTFRAAYFVAADGQSDICLTHEDQAHLSDAELIEAAIAEAHYSSLIGSVDISTYDHEAMEDVEVLTSEQDVRDGLRIGEYTR